MDSREFPSNSEASKRGGDPEKNVTRVTSSDPTRRKKSLRKQLGETFVAGDLKSAVAFVLLDVLLPAAKDTIVESVHQGAQKLMFGESRRRGSASPLAGPMGYVSYNRMTSGNRQASSQRALSRQARAAHNFDDIVLENRAEAEDVIDRLFDLVSRYDQATVADLYTLVGLAADHTDHRWGWTNLQGAGVSRIRGGYLLDLPEPEPVN